MNRKTGLLLCFILSLIFLGCRTEEHKKKVVHKETAESRHDKTGRRSTPAMLPAAPTPVEVPASTPPQLIGDDTVIPDSDSATPSSVEIGGHLFTVDGGKYYYAMPDPGTIWGVERTLGMRHWSLFIHNNKAMEQTCREIEDAKKCRHGRWARQLPAGALIEVPLWHIKRLQVSRIGKSLTYHTKKIVVVPRRGEPGKQVKDPAPSQPHGATLPPILYEELDKVPERVVPEPQPPVKTGRPSAPQVLPVQDLVARCAAAVLSVVDGHHGNNAYRVCLASGSVSKPMPFGHALQLVRREPDVMSEVGELPTEYVCPMSADCSRKEAWQVL